VSELRTWAAIRLAKDVDTCCALLCREPVDPSRIDADELAFLRELKLVRLDFRAIDLLEPQLRKGA
jgi:hypothetical protein